jgi:glycosyltransferase involved in cell wall biosynthesis
MKILHICTHDLGGAAAAAIRLHNALLKNRIDSNFLFLNNNKNSVQHAYVHEHKKNNITKKLIRKVRPKQTQNFVNHTKLLQKPKLASKFSFAKSDFDIKSNPIFKKADIINLHWVADFIDYPSFFSKLKKPVVWTLHDMYPFSGGFHYSGDCEKFQDEYSCLDQEIFEEKKKAIDNFKNLSIVCPSKWLLAESQKSILLKRFFHYHIPYSLDLSVFKSYVKNESRNIFNIPLGKKVLLFVSANVDAPRKGLDLLITALTSVNWDNLIVCALGKSSNTNNFENLISIDYLDDFQKLAMLYSSVDAVVLPSRQDNLPNVMLESLACGTPVISYEVGGMKDVIETGFNGILASRLNSDTLADAISDFLSGKYNFDAQAIRQFSAEQFNDNLQSQRYCELYQKLV